MFARDSGDCISHEQYRGSLADVRKLLAHDKQFFFASGLN
jgi:hypothetical protein